LKSQAAEFSTTSASLQGVTRGPSNS